MREIERLDEGRQLPALVRRVFAATAATVGIVSSLSCSETASGAAGGGAAPARITLGREPVTRRVWVGPAVDPSLRPSYDSPNVAYIDRVTGDIAVHDLVNATDRRLTNAAAGATGDFYDAPIIAPDGQRIAFNRWNGAVDQFELGLMDVAAGRAQTIAAKPLNVRLPLTWSRDGRRMAVALPRPDGLVDLGVVDLPDRVAVVPEGSRLLRSGGGLQFGPDARTLLADVRQHNASSDSCDVVGVDVASGRTWAVITHDSDDRLAGLTPDGSVVLFFSDRNGTTALYAQPVTAELRPLGTPLLVRGDVWSAIGLGTTSAGSLLYTIQTGVQTMYAVQLDPATGSVGAPRPVSAAEGIARAPVADWTGDGASTVQNFRPGRGRAGPVLTMRSVLSGDTREVSTRLTEINTLHAAPDGARVMVNAKDERNRIGVFLVDVATGATRAIANASYEIPSMVRGAGWSSDSRIAFYTVEEFRRDHLRVVARDVANGAERTVLDIPCTASCGGRISPDGHLFAMIQPIPETRGAARLLVYTVGSGEAREVARIAEPESFAGNPSWTPDGRALIIALTSHDDPKRMARFLIAHTDGSPPRTVTVDVGGPVTGVRVHPDGRQILFFAGTTAFELWSLDHLQFRPSR